MPGSPALLCSPRAGRWWQCCRPTVSWPVVCPQPRVGAALPPRLLLARLGANDLSSCLPWFSAENTTVPELSSLIPCDLRELGGLHHDVGLDCSLSQLPNLPVALSQASSCTQAADVTSAETSLTLNYICNMQTTL